MTDPKTRQEQIMKILSDQDTALRGEDLAQRLRVTRQVVVHDIALMRAHGMPIIATPRGYLLQSSNHQRTTVLSVRHAPQATRDELYTLVDYGLIVDNVMVEHPVYGELTGGLALRSRHDVDHFLSQVARHQAALLSSLTQGYHYHTVTMTPSANLTEAIRALRQCDIEVFGDEN